MKINFKKLFKKKEKISTNETPDYAKAFKDILESANLVKQYDNNRPERICVKFNDNIFLEIKSEEELEMVLLFLKNHISFPPNDFNPQPCPPEFSKIVSDNFYDMI